MIIGGVGGVRRQKTNLWFWVNFRVHLRADEGEQAHPVPSPQQEVSAIGHVEGLILQNLPGDEGGGPEPQSLLQGAV